MNTEKIEIKNRKKQKIVVVLEKAENPKGLAFVVHGLGGNKDEPQIRTFARAFLDEDIDVVLFDSTNTFGESDGDYEDATTTNYFEDLEDVIQWASEQEWYKEPFYLASHSLGGISIILYAEMNPSKIKALAPISTVISGKLSIETPRYQEGLLEEWKKTGWRILRSGSNPNLIKKLKYSHLEDRLRYNILNDADKLTMPVLLIVGSKDDTTPPKHQKILLDALPGKKEIHIIDGAEHVFRDEMHLKKIKEIFIKWIKETEE